MHLTNKSWDVDNITSQLNKMIRECKNCDNDGFTSWGIKQDLYLIKFLLDQGLSDLPNFGEIEKDYLNNLEKKRIIKILKN